MIQTCMQKETQQSKPLKGIENKSNQGECIATKQSTTIPLEEFQNIKDFPVLVKLVEKQH